MVKVEITFKCDKCGKEKKKEYVAKGHNEPEYMIDNDEGAYAPTGWIHCDDDDNEVGFIYCKKCSAEFEKENPNGVWVA